MQLEMLLEMLLWAVPLCDTELLSAELGFKTQR